MKNKFHPGLNKFADRRSYIRNIMFVSYGNNPVNNNHTIRIHEPDTTQEDPYIPVAGPAHLLGLFQSPGPGTLIQAAIES